MSNGEQEAASGVCRQSIQTGCSGLLQLGLRLGLRCLLVEWDGAQDAGEGTDFHAAAAGMVSITPLQVDLTRYSQMQTVGEWLQA